MKLLLQFLNLAFAGFESFLEIFGRLCEGFFCFRQRATGYNNYVRWDKPRHPRITDLAVLSSQLWPFRFLPLRIFLATHVHSLVGPRLLLSVLFNGSEYACKSGGYFSHQIEPQMLW